MRRIALFALLVIFMLVPVMAQVTQSNINYGETVVDTITGDDFFDHWRFNANAGDVIRVRMEAADGLAPLIGISDGSLEIVVRSDTEGEAQPNQIAELNYVIPATGAYVIVATRVGNENGATAGSYALTLELLESAASRSDDRTDVTFRCGEIIATSAVWMRFPLHADEYRVSVYGLGDFEPVIRSEIFLQEQVEAVEQCNNSARFMQGDRLTLPPAIEHTHTDDQHGARIIVNDSGGTAEGLALTVGSVDGASGRYVLVVEGLSLSDENPIGEIDIRQGPRAVSIDTLVYMVGNRSRIDPVIRWYQIDQACDDAGLRDCADVPGLARANIVFSDGDRISGDRFDAGLRLNPGSTDIMRLELTNIARNTSGDYVLLVMGELP